MSRLMRRAAAVVLVFAASCAEPPDPDQPPATTTSAPTTTAPAVAPWLKIGTGITSMSPLEDGDPIELVFGPQGGWHIDVTARFGALSPDGLVLTYRALDVETGADLGFPIQAVLASDRVLHEPDGSFVRVGDRIVLDIEAAGDVAGGDLDLRVEARAPCCETTASVRVAVVDELP